MEETAPPAQQAVPVERAPTRSRMIVVICLLTFVVLGLLSIAVLGQNYQESTPQPTPSIGVTPTVDPRISTDETYTNTIHDFSIRNPEGWTMYELPNNAHFIPPGQTVDIINGKIEIRVAVKTPGKERNLPFEQYVRIAAPLEIQGPGELISLTSIKTQSGPIGYKALWKLKEGTPSPHTTITITYFELPNDTSHTVQIIVGDTAYIMDYNQMLPSFKFLDQNTEQETMCGGIAGLACPTGFTCQLDGTYPDASGKCVKANEVVCTADVMLCPDGSYVGRSGPNCEFSSCPGE